MFFFSSVVLGLYMPQETESCPMTFFQKAFVSLLVIRIKTALVFV